MTHCINIAYLQQLVDQLKVDVICQEGNVTIVMDDVLVDFVYYWYNNHLELAIMSQEQKSMFHHGYHIWDDIGFLIDLQFKTQTCVIDRIDLNIAKGLTESQLFHLCDNVCNTFLFKKCKLRTFPNHIYCGVTMRSFTQDLICLLLSHSKTNVVALPYGTKYGFFGKGNIDTYIQDLFTYNMYTVVESFPNCKEMLKKSYELRELHYFDKDLSFRELGNFDKNVKQCKEILQNSKLFFMGEFLIWCYVNETNELENMLNLLFPAPVYGGRSKLSPFFWIGAFDVIWKHCNNKQKCYIK